MDVHCSALKRVHAVGGALLLVGALALSACGGSGGSDGSPSSKASEDEPVRVLMGTAPDTVDPSLSYSTQGWELDYVVYTPLLQYAGEDTTRLVPGLAKDLPQVSADGKTYKLQLRPGLTYSNGEKVRAEDFAHAVERSLKLRWGGASLFTDNILGADAFNKGKADSIKGIEADNATGDITVRLTRAYGPFANILASIAAAPIPSSTPMKATSQQPPAGAGPYKFGKVEPNSSYELVRNPSFAEFGIEGVPTGDAERIQIDIQENTSTAVQSVLDNQADVFDPGSALPPGTIPKLQAQAKGRYEQVAIPAAYYYSFNTKVAPFDKLEVRQAVSLAMDRPALSRLSAGGVQPACSIVPEGIPGSGGPTCEVAGVEIDPKVPPSAETVEKAKEMIRDAGAAGQEVTVWSPDQDPAQAFGGYLNSLLLKLGFKSKIKALQEDAFESTTQNQKTKAQVRTNSWFMNYPYPGDFFVPLRASSIYPVNNQNFPNINDSRLEREADKLTALPESELEASVDDWKALDRYVTDQAWQAGIGVASAPKFTSDRIAFDKVVMNPVYFLVYSTLGYSK